MANTMHEWKAGQLHSGSKTGPIVKSQKQAIAIGLDEERRMGMGGMVPPGRQAQNRAIHASQPSMMPRPPMRSPMPMPAPMPRPAPMPMPNPMPGAAPGYLGRYPAMPRMAGGGPVQAGGDDSASSDLPVPPSSPYLGIGYVGGPTGPDQQWGGPDTSQNKIPLGATQYPGGSYYQPTTGIYTDAKGGFSGPANATGPYGPYYRPENPDQSIESGGGALRYQGQYPKMAAGGPVQSENYYAQGGLAGESDVSSANGPVLPNQPSMQQSQGVGYSQGGDVLSDQDRDDLPSSDFAVPSKAPGSGSYPMPDRKHAAVAKGFAKRFGSPAVQSAVAAKAKSKFGMSQGGPVGTDEQTDSPGPEKVKVNGRAARVAKFEKENGDKEI